MPQTTKKFGLHEKTILFAVTLATFAGLTPAAAQNPCADYSVAKRLECRRAYNEKGKLPENGIYDTACALLAALVTGPPAPLEVAKAVRLCAANPDKVTCSDTAEFIETRLPKNTLVCTAPNIPEHEFPQTKAPPTFQDHVVAAQKQCASMPAGAKRLSCFRAYEAKNRMEPNIVYEDACRFVSAVSTNPSARLDGAEAAISLCGASPDKALCEDARTFVSIRVPNNPLVCTGGG